MDSQRHKRRIWYFSLTSLGLGINDTENCLCLFIYYVTDGEEGMKLPYGVTGFFEAEAPPETDGRLFKQLCFDFASRNSGKVINFKGPEYPANFYHAQIEIKDNQIYILLNQQYPYLVAASAVEFCNIKFIDEPAIKEYFSPYYQVLNTDELNAPFKSNLVNDTELNRAELEQIACWKPEIIGQIIFNYWD